MDTSALIALLSVIVVAVGIFIPARQSIRRDRREEERYRADQTQKEVDKATAPLQRENDRLNLIIVDKNRVIEERNDRINQLLDDRRNR